MPDDLTVTLDGLTAALLFVGFQNGLRGALTNLAEYPQL